MKSTIPAHMKPYAKDAQKRVSDGYDVRGKAVKLQKIEARKKNKVDSHHNQVKAASFFLTSDGIEPLIRSRKGRNSAMNPANTPSTVMMLCRKSLVKWSS